MRDQAMLAQKCLEVEQQGGSVIEWLKSNGFYSPRATWERLQLNELRRSKNGLTDGKGKIVMVKNPVVTAEVKAKAIEIMLDGGNVLDYLKTLQLKNPSSAKRNILQQLQRNDPETYGKIMERLRAEDPKKTKKAEPAAPAPAKHTPITQPLVYRGMIVRGLEGDLGYYNRRITRSGEDFIDFEMKDTGDVISLTVEQWKTFKRDLDNAVEILGRDLNA